MIFRHVLIVDFINSPVLNIQVVIIHGGQDMILIIVVVIIIIIIIIINLPVTKPVEAYVRNATLKHACIVWVDRTAIFKEFLLEWILQNMARHFVTHKQIQADKLHPI